LTLKFKLTTKTQRTRRPHQVLGALVVFFLLIFTAMFSSCRKAPKKPQNIILITIDTLRADALSVYGSKTPTPFMQQFAENAAVFDHAFTSAPITLPAHTSLLSGMYPPSHGVRHNGVYKAQSSLTLISELAHNAGFATAAFVGAAPLAANYGLNQGFDVYDDSFPRAPTQQGMFAYAERNAEQVRLAAQNWLSNLPQSKSFLLWIHFFDPHHPYLTHGYAGLTPYQEEVVYTDHQLSEFFVFLKQKHLDANNLVIITADHGEAFGEHGEISHSLFIYNTTLRIPLMITGPGVQSRRVSDLVRIVDVSPTIAEIMGWKFPASIDGVSLLPLLHGQKLKSLDNYSESFASAIDFGWSPLACIQDQQFKYIQAPKPEFYDLKADSNEDHNLASSQEAAKYKMKVEALLNRANVNSEHKPSAEEMERLRSLGYVGTVPQNIRWDAPDPKDKLQVARRIAELTMQPMTLPERAKAYAEIVQLDPSNPLLLVRFGEVLLQLKDYADAEHAFQTAIQIGYPAASPYNGLAAVYYYQERAADAEAILQKAVDSGVADGETYFNLAEFLYNRGHKQQAYTYYNRSIMLGHKLAAERKAQLMRNDSPQRH
jgi:choline-sulfatase